MPKFVCSYAYDIGCFRDFVVEAQNQNEALGKITEALRAGKFEALSAEPVWENGVTNERVFVLGLATHHAPDTTLEELISQNHVFSPATNLCTRCGRSAEDDAVETAPCRT